MRLLRGMARTAVVAGTATAVAGRVSRRQNARFAAQDQAAQDQPENVTPEAAPAAPDPYTEIEKLGQLKKEGLITQDEFDAKKKEILGL